MLHEVRDLMYDNTFIITYIVLLGTAIKMNQYARINSLLCFNWGGGERNDPTIFNEHIWPFLLQKYSSLEDPSSPWNIEWNWARLV